MSTFLKLFANCFHVQTNLVTLLQKPILSDLHIQQEQARTKDCINNNFALSTTVNTITGNNSQTSMTAQRNIINNNNNTIGSNATSTTTTTVGDFKLSGPVSHVKPAGGAYIMPPASLRSEPNSDFDSYIPELEMKMESLCENNLPKLSAAQQQQQQQQAVPSAPSTPSQAASLSPVLSPIPITPPTAGQTERPGYAGNKNQSLKARINNLVIKTLAENLEKDKQQQQQLQQQQQQQNNAANAAQAAPTATAVNTTATVASSSADHTFTGDTWKVRVLQKLRIIDNIRESLFVTDAINKSCKNDQQIVISVDCEGINLGVKGELTLIEIGTIAGEAFIFDVLTCPSIMTDGGLKALLENERIIKVIHDCRNDSVNLFNQFKVLLRNVFDTQVSSIDFGIACHACIHKCL